jgi:hypothetical protein
MGRMRTRLALLTIAILVVVPLSSSGRPSEAALSDGFRYKWPWLPATGYSITTLPYQEEHDCNHECVDAYDFVITNDDVRSSAQGSVWEWLGDRARCDPDGHLGNYVRVHVGGSPYRDVYYGHFNTVAAPQPFSTIYQGDYVGQQGATCYRATRASRTRMTNVESTCIFSSRRRARE